MSKKDSIYLSSEAIELGETSTYLTLLNRLCYYGEPNMNNVCLPIEGALERAETLVGMPVVAKYKVDAEGKPDLGSHEMSVNPFTKEVKFGTENIGVHTDVEIKDDVVKVNGVTKSIPCLFAKLKIWKRNKRMVDAIKRLFSEGKLTNSWEVLTSSYTIKDGVKVLNDYCFEAVALLGSAVTPAYNGCAETLSVASFKEYPEQIIAEALAQDVAFREKEENQLEKTIDYSALTERDLRDLIIEECRKKIKNYCWLGYHFPADRVVWCEYEGRETELDYALFTYEVKDNAVEVSDPEYVKLTVSIQNVNEEIAKKDAALAKANETINNLMNEIATLEKYRVQIEEQNRAKEEEERKARRDSLIAYALKSKFITEFEIANDEAIAKMIENIDEAGIKGIIAERFMKSLDTAEPETAAFKNRSDKHVSTSIEDDDAEGSVSFIKAFLSKNTNY